MQQSNASASPDKGSVDAAPPPTAPRSALRWLRTIALVAAAVVLGVLAARAATSALRPHLYSGTVLQGDELAPPLDGLVSSSGEGFDLAAHRGEVVLVYFGYTNCPDVCPTTLSNAARARSLLDDRDQERTNLVMVSVDPDRDRAISLSEYVEFFDPTFTGITGSVADIDRAASVYGVFYEFGEGSIETGYTVDHTASLIGIDPEGSIRIVWGPDVQAEPLAADIEELLS